MIALTSGNNENTKQQACDESSSTTSDSIEVTKTNQVNLSISFRFAQLNIDHIKTIGLVCWTMSLEFSSKSDLSNAQKRQAASTS